MFKTNADSVNSWKKVGKRIYVFDKVVKNKHSRKCGDFPWNNKWHEKMNSKPPRYYCPNCDYMFYTGKFWKNDDEMYDDVCPSCGCYPVLTFEELVEEYKELRNEYEKLMTHNYIVKECKKKVVIDGEVIMPLDILSEEQYLKLKNNKNLTIVKIFKDGETYL